jgi:hypothetical protein
MRGLIEMEDLIGTGDIGWVTLSVVYTGKPVSLMARLTLSGKRGRDGCGHKQPAAEKGRVNLHVG